MNFQDFRSSTTFRVVRKIKGIVREIRREIQEGKSSENAVVTLRPEGDVRGKVLFSYIIDAFLLPPGAPIPKSHTNFWQSWQMAQTFVQLGYEVDVIHWTNHHFIPKKNYAILVDVRRNLERLAPLLNHDCIKILHIDTAHILFHNAAEANRLLALQKRRGVTLNPRRFEMPNQGIEHADYGTATGNDFVVGTFAYANKKIFKLPSPCGVALDWIKRDWSQCRKNFLWFSSGGLVHKGLDLALEAFREMPECHLTVCAPVEKEKAFVRAYYRELYETSNIQTIGWVDIESENFKNIAATCGATLHLSCSEGGAPSVKTCMHAGLVPIVSYESGIDVHDYGYSLMNCSVDNIKLVVRKFAQLPPNEVESKAQAAWAYARQHYTRENFSKEYSRVMVEILSEVRSKILQR
ncbi:MAG: glycosyltransferase [Nitrospirales bacterium]